MNLYKVVDQNGKQVFDDLLIARQVTEKTGCTKNNVAQAAANFALVNKKYRIIPEDIKLSKALDVELLAEWDRYRNSHMDKTDGKQITVQDVYVVWSCKTLQNSKALLSTTVPDGMYYELTYNGDKHELYLDAYKKFQNMCFKL